MGEPLANLDSVIESIRVACEPSGLAVDGRAITVCTAGLPAGIRRLAREVPAIRLAISIASPIPAVRGRLMPIDRVFPKGPDAQSSTPGSEAGSMVYILNGINVSHDAQTRRTRLASRTEGRLSTPHQHRSIQSHRSCRASSFVRSSRNREAFRKCSEAGVPSHKPSTAERRHLGRPDSWPNTRTLGQPGRQNGFGC
jgi:hypothetical protein